jgi:hypothetical protein
MTAPAWSIDLLAQLDAADAHARRVVQGLTDAQLNWKAEPMSWSVGQCLEHLSISNELYTGPIVEALHGRPRKPVETITPGWFGRWFLRSFIEPDTQKIKAKAPGKIKPVASHLDASILDRFLASNAGVRAAIALARDVDVNRVRFRNPFIPVIRFTVGTGLLLLVRHDRRHLLQADRVRGNPAFPSASP